MKKAFKPLGIAAAVAAASAGQVQAQPTVASNFLGDLALVPYYTVNDGWVTAIHIVNTSDSTQVVKFRFRRATDSMDALDFNIVMSPQDVYAGFLSDNDGTISWQADDTTCTVPETTDGLLTMPSIYRPDAETGYVEIISMGQPVDEDEPIAEAAEHITVDGEFVPRSCEAVRSNFFADGSTSDPGVADYNTTFQRDLLDNDDDDSTSDIVENAYVDSDNVLKVSYSITDVASGIEFGDNAVHLEDFITVATMTNQQFGYFSGDLNGFDFPDLNGPEPVSMVTAAERGVFEDLRSTDVLGVLALVNEWSSNPANQVATDWVVTLPGQYTMFKLLDYVASLDGSVAAGFPWFPTLENGSPTDNPECPRLNGPDEDGDPVTDPAEVCDWRDMPVELNFAAWNREEFAGTAPDEDLTVSPAPPGEILTAFLPKEANVITFGDTGGILDMEDTNVSANLGQPFGWLSVSVDSVDDNIGLCDWVGSEDNGAGFPSNTAGSNLTNVCSAFTDPGGVPVIGFAAWGRSIAANPDASYGRIIAHSAVVS
ncbi:MAG: hypothetical protein AAFY29_09665 [Pseudomonadota bacterium]